MWLSKNDSAGCCAATGVRPDGHPRLRSRNLPIARERLADPQHSFAVVSRCGPTDESKIGSNHRVFFS